MCFSGKMSLSKTASSEDNLINLQDASDRFDRVSSPLNFSRYLNGDNDKTANRSAFRSMPGKIWFLTRFLMKTRLNVFLDLSAQHNQGQPAARTGPGGASTGPHITSTTSLLGGRVTPTSICTTSSGARHYTLKEYEQELDKLQKENFNLKVRIWHLEEEFRRRGTITDDMAKRVSAFLISPLQYEALNIFLQDLENQISELTAKLDEKDRMLKESL